MLHSYKFVLFLEEEFMDASLHGPFGRIDLASDTLTIGRKPENKLVLADAKASSRHAEIRSADNGYTITDLGSTNGTFVNEQQLRPNEPQQLNSGDTVRIGDTRFSYEGGQTAQVDSTVYEKGAGAAYAPTVAAPPANTAYGRGQQDNQPLAQNSPPAYEQQPAYPPPPVYAQPNQAYPAQPAGPYAYPPATAPKRSNRTLFIILGSVVGGLVLLCILASVLVAITRSTPEKTLTAYCDAVKSGDYPTAYNQYAKNIQRQVSEAQFESVFNNIKITGCSVSNTSDDGTVGMGTISFVTDKGSSGVDDYRLIQENGVWKISNETARK